MSDFDWMLPFRADSEHRTLLFAMVTHRDGYAREFQAWSDVAEWLDEHVSLAGLTNEVVLPASEFPDAVDIESLPEALDGTMGGDWPHCKEIVAAAEELADGRDATVGLTVALSLVALVERIRAIATEESANAAAILGRLTRVVRVDGGAHVALPTVH